MHVYIFLCYIIMWEWMYPPYRRWGQFYPTKISLVLSHYVIVALFPPPLLTPCNQFFVLHLQNFVITRMLYKWTHIVCDLLRLAFFKKILHRPFIFVSCCRYRQFSHFSCWVVIVCMYTVYLLTCCRAF